MADKTVGQLTPTTTLGSGDLMVVWPAAGPGPLQSIDYADVFSAIQTDLALGGASLLDVGMVAGTVAAGDDARFGFNVLAYGADPTGVANSSAAFSAAAAAAGAGGQVNVPAGTFKLNSTPVGSPLWFLDRATVLTGAGAILASTISYGPITPGAHITWVNAVDGGIFEYLEQNATQSSPATYLSGGIGLFSSTRSSTGSGSSAEAFIGLAAFGYNDKVAGLAGTWGLYSTVYRIAGVLGPTHGLEIDVANAGATVPLFPSTISVAGLSEGIRLAAGGEAAIAPGVAKTASAAITIASNDPLFVACFDKGILFHNRALSGADGATGNGTAIAFATGHDMLWFNNSTQVCGEIVCNNRLIASAMRLDLSQFGTLFQDRQSGVTQFQVANINNAANWIFVGAAAAGSAPFLQVTGTDTNIDFKVFTQGTGLFALNYGAIAAAVSANFVADHKIPMRVGGVLYYVAASVTSW